MSEEMDQSFKDSEYQHQINEYLAFKSKVKDNRENIIFNEHVNDFGSLPPRRGKGRGYNRARGHGGHYRSGKNSSNNMQISYKNPHNHLSMGRNHQNTGINSRGPKVAHCDLCDKNFSTQEDYSTHISEHANCPAQNCKFQAHYMIVENHFNNVHTIGPGQKQNSELESCWQLNTDEDIKKWRDNRKRKFPKLADVEKASSEREAKMNLKNEAKRVKREQFEKREGDRQMKMLETRQRQEAEQKAKKEDQVLGKSLEKEKKKEADTPAIHEPKKEEPSTKRKNQGPKITNELPDRLKYDQLESKGLWPPAKASFDNFSTARNAPTTLKNSLTAKNSLLSKLLSSEAAREKNILIQCIQHTVKHNFYQELLETTNLKKSACDHDKSIQSKSKSSTTNDVFNKPKSGQGPLTCTRNLNITDPETTNNDSDSSASSLESSNQSSSYNSSSFDSSEISRDIELADGPDDENLLAILASYLN